MIQRALVSVADKTGIVPFAAALVARGVAIVSTGGSAQTLTAAGRAGHRGGRGHRLSRNSRRAGEDPCTRRSMPACWHAVTGGITSQR